MDTFRCIERQSVTYLNLTGNSHETAAHLEENQSITLICSFSEELLILRLSRKS